jgi:hypothetical protein
MSEENLEEYFTEYELRLVGAYLSNRLSETSRNSDIYWKTKTSKDMLMGLVVHIDDEDMIEKFNSLTSIEAQRLLKLVKAEYMPENYKEIDNSLIIEGD